MSETKKVLIITYYWPPSGGSGVQRWLKMSKYLSEFGWEPIIYTAENGETPAIDHSLEKDIRPGTTVVKLPIWEPYTIYKRFTGKKKTDKMGAGFLNESSSKGKNEGLAMWVRGNLFIPDARKFWIKPSIKFLKKYLKENPVDAIISTGPPHSMHMIALGVSQKLNIPWIADFRDPWTNIDFYHQLRLSKWADKKHHRLEKKVIQTANKVVTVSWHWLDDLKELGAKDVEVITNGFDHEDFSFDNLGLSKKFSITHIGSMNKDRNPVSLWPVLRELCDELETFSDHLQIQFIGKTDHTIFEDIEKKGLKKFVKNVTYMPHNEVIKELAKSQVLLLAVNDTPNVGGIVPGKIFEYMAVERPILAIGPPDADSGRIIKETNSGVILDFNDQKGIKQTIKSYFADYLKGDLKVDSSKLYEKYSRKNLAKHYSEVLNEIV